jgi:hypothetical protein
MSGFCILAACLLPLICLSSKTRLALEGVGLKHSYKMRASIFAGKVLRLLCSSLVESGRP